MIITTKMFFYNKKNSTSLIIKLTDNKSFKNGYISSKYRHFLSYVLVSHKIPSVNISF